MKTVPGQVRTCPICKSTILESASVCPGCLHHLRFDAHSAKPTWSSSAPLRVEGTIRHAVGGEPWEYSVVLVIRNEEGEELARQVLGVGALKPSEERTFALTVEVLTPEEAEAAETE
ncbi:MAG: hypothetical protein ACREMD_14415 [Gemmatimonadota bacterium]